jgi:molybdopterin/thiamine biosynthesis adenylyltransferase/rhodanese-related sulfurtransferase
MNSLSQDESLRYARHLTLNEIGLKGQKKLKAAKVICVGAGGLGCPALLYLAAAGVGTIGIVDDDFVDHSNLQRQILFTTDDVGKLKSETAKKRLLALNPNLTIVTYSHKITHDNILAILTGYDVVIDATDNYTSRYLINDACHFLKIPDVFAGISQFTGQCAVFALPDHACYRCLFPERSDQIGIANCVDAGVIGVLPGILGNLQAMETIKLILGIGETLAGKLFSLDVLSMSSSKLTLNVNPNCVLCSKQKSFHDMSHSNPFETNDFDMLPTDFFHLRDKKIPHLLLDVRDDHEYREKNLGGYSIPLADLAKRARELNHEQLIIVHCQTGVRSLKALNWLKANGYANVRNLKGGMQACLPVPGRSPNDLLVLD